MSRPTRPHRSRSLRRRGRAVTALFLALVAVLAGAPEASFAGGPEGQPEPSILVVDVDGPIDPVIADLVGSALEEAETGSVVLFVLAIDSPGALDVDVAPLVAAVASADVPVAAWVKGGGRAEREAVTLTLAADVVSMATDARIGRAGESLDGRDPAPVPDRIAPVVEAVTGSDRYEALVGARRSPQDALDAEIIDVVAPSLRDLVATLDGRPVAMGAETRELVLGEVIREGGETRKQVFPIRFRELDLGAQLQHALTSPFVALLLLLTGLALIVFEFFAIGVGLAGVAGALLVVAAFVGFAHLPVDWLSFSLVAASMVALSVDVQAGAPRFWAAVGSILLLVGSLRFYAGAGALDPPVWQVLLLDVGVLVFVLPGLAAVIRSRFSTPTIGRESMVGERGTARADFDPEGVVEVRGALWKARSTRAAHLRAGDPIEVTEVRGLVLEVLPFEDIDDRNEDEAPGGSGSEGAAATGPDGEAADA